MAACVVNEADDEASMATTGAGDGGTPAARLAALTAQLPPHLRSRFSGTEAVAEGGGSDDARSDTPPAASDGPPAAAGVTF